jgi:penicillin amidase
MEKHILRTLVILLLALAGCGDSDSGTTAGPSPAVPTASPSPVATASATVIPSASVTPFPSASHTATSVPSPTPSPTTSPTAVATLSDADRIRTLPQTESWDLEGLTDEVHVVRTEGDVPHIYAHNRRDLSFVQGFLLGRDRYFMMDLTRRLGLGRVTELIGDAALDTDVQTRLSGMTYVADRIANGFSPEHAELADAFAAGVNAYIAQVKASNLPVPSELRLARALLGVSNPRDLMEPFTRRDIAGILAVIIYQSSYETGDVGRAAAAAGLDGTFVGAPFEALRLAGLRQDVAPAVKPLNLVGSAAGFGLETGDTFIPGPTPDNVPGAQPLRAVSRAARTTPSGVNAGLASNLAARLDAFEERLGRTEGFGSNSWAVSGQHTPSGATLVEGDGHLGLDIPSIFFQIGMDTSVFGGGAIHQLGIVIPGFFIMPVGTNGNVAWSQTQLSADITDWYQEQVQLDENGLPAATLFQGTMQPLQRVDEAYIIRNVPLLGSLGRTETWPRWTLFDGRFLGDIEGRRANPDTPLNPGESLVYTMTGFVIPGDTNGDGIVSGISFDYTAFDIGRVLDGADGFGQSADIEEFRQYTKKLIGYSQNIAAGDSHGGILYTSYHAVPCRGYLPRQENGEFAPGADPQQLLDGTQYGGFEVPTTNGLVDETASGGDPQRCLVPFDSTPQSLNPSRGYVFTANNDPDHIAFDNSIENDAWYIGGSWDTGFRADTLNTELAKTVEDGNGDVARMAAIEANHTSRLGERFTPYLLEAIDNARTLTMVDRILTPTEQRRADRYTADAAAMDEVAQRLQGWLARGFDTPSGVETFYHTVAANEPDDAVATMIFNAWIGRFVRGVWDDERINGLFHEGDQTRVTLILGFLAARDSGETGGFASYNPDTGESIFFDIRDTAEVETSREIMLNALTEALTFLQSAPTAPGSGGFGTTDMSQWIWGLRHQVRFESLLAPFLGNDPQFAVFTAPFNIDTSKLPLAPSLPADDPRKGLKWFPRPGDQWNVDAGNPGFGGTNFTYGSGPVMRMVFALKDGAVSGLNIIPGGQSGLTDSPHFADQAALWLGNQAYPARFAVDDVVAGAAGHEVYRPASASR